MSRQGQRSPVFVLTLALLAAAARAGGPSQEIRLVALIVVDQLRADYLTRWEQHFGDDGFRKLIVNGAHFRNARYSHGTSSTAPGHASLATGRLPRQHGIVSNEWYLPEAGDKAQAAVIDPQVRTIGLGLGAVATGKSPVHVIGSGLGDEMKLADRRSRVFSVSLKDRAAIFLAGKTADRVFWWDKGTGRFVSSTYYMDALPEYVQAYNREKYTDRWAGQTWEPLLAPDAYAGTYPLDPQWHSLLGVFGHAFPHRLPEKPDLTYYAYFYATPFGNDAVIELLRRIMEHEKPGAGPAADLLCISFSSNDIAGHCWGPESAEVLDTTARTDRQIAEILQLLDRHVGLEHCLVALTGDHGVTTSAPLASLVGIQAGMIDGKAVVAQLNQRIRETLGTAAPAHDVVLGMGMPWVYCRPGFEVLDRQHDGRLTDMIVHELRAVDGVAAVFSARDLSGPAPSPDDLQRYLAWRSFHPQRSGQFYLHVRPFWYRKTDKIAGHSGGFLSDRTVPILLCGPGVRHGVFFTPADPIDIPVTLAALLGIQPPADAMGRVLHEAIERLGFSVQSSGSAPRD